MESYKNQTSRYREQMDGARGDGKGVGERVTGFKRYKLPATK